MREVRIYTPQEITINTEITLDEQAANHIARVLRMKIENKVCLFNGKGGAWLCQLTQVKKNQVTALVQEQINTNNASSLHTHLGQGLSRGEKMDYVIQKATELGVNAITPIITNRCEVRLDKVRTEKRLRHWQQVAISACEQSGRNLLPIINPPTSIDNWVAERSDNLKLVLHPEGSTHKLSDFKTPQSVSLLIGPEGGLSAQEVNNAQNHQFNCITFGPRILRTETAPIAIISTSQFLWGDCK